MKIGILSDIHANSAALDAVFDSPRFADIDALIVAGDFVGYYFDPKYVIDRIRSFNKPTFCVKGNHEEMLLEVINNPKQLHNYTLKYGPGISIAREQLDDLDLNWILSLPHPLFVNDFSCSFLVCHGSPSSIDEYIYPDNSLTDLFRCIDDEPSVIILGHTHYPFVRQLDNSLILNPGSVGQPRNRVPGAHWALFDTSTMNVDMLVESYDSADLQDQCRAVAPQHPYLHEVLTRL